MWRSYKFRQIMEILGIQAFPLATMIFPPIILAKYHTEQSSKDSYCSIDYLAIKIFGRCFEEPLC